MVPLPMFDNARTTAQPCRSCREKKRSNLLVEVAPGVTACFVCDGGLSWAA